jgi:RNA-directed DNA polymerase
VLVHGTELDAHALHEQIGPVLATMGLSFSPEKTRVVHLADGLDFLGFHIQLDFRTFSGSEIPDY